jgi:glutamyl-tRNA reductase
MKETSLARLVLLGLSYRTAPIALREKLSCTLADLPADWQAVDARFTAVQEIALLSTCNRTELIAVLNCPGLDSRGLLADLLALLTGVETAVFQHHLYVYTGPDAARHLCRVATGLDSQVLGEPQILGQVADTFKTAVAANSAGPLLNELFPTVIRCGKRARSETSISKNPVSTSAIAVSQAQTILGDLRSRRHLIIGAGEMSKLALKALQARGATNIALVNRSRTRADSLAEADGLTVYDFTDLETAVAQADLVISATAATEPVLTYPTVANSLQQRGERPLILIDIAVPRDIDPTVRHLPNVHLLDADQLQQELDEALTARRQQVPAVEAIIGSEIETLNVVLHSLALRPLIVDLRHKAEAIRQQELKRTLRYLGDVDSDTLDRLQHFSRALVNKLLHEPTLCLRHKAVDEEAAVYASTVRDLFGLDPTSNHD